MRRSPSTQVNGALTVYLVLLLSLQLFLLAVAAEAFLSRDAGLAWAATGVSSALAIGAFLMGRLLRRD